MGQRSSIIGTLKENCLTLEDYETLVSQLEYFKNNRETLSNRRLRILEFAQANLIWEKNEQDVYRAYQVCLFLLRTNNITKLYTIEIDITFDTMLDFS